MHCSHFGGGDGRICVWMPASSPSLWTPRCAACVSSYASSATPSPQASSFQAWPSASQAWSTPRSASFWTSFQALICNLFANCRDGLVGSRVMRDLSSTQRNGYTIDFWQSGIITKMMIGCRVNFIYWLVLPFCNFFAKLSSATLTKLLDDKTGISSKIGRYN